MTERAFARSAPRSPRPISASITEAVASAFENTKGRRAEAFEAVNGDLLVTASDIAGAGFEPATFGL